MSSAITKDKTDAIQRRNEVRPELEKAKHNIIARLPKGYDGERFFLGLATVLQKNPDLLKCTPDSLILAGYEAAELGVNLSPGLGLGYLIPYGTTAQFQMGYRGMIQKCYETGLFREIFAEVVYSNDTLEVTLAPRSLKHTPNMKDRGKPIGAYSYFVTKDGVIDFEYMTDEQVQRRRNHSKQPNSLMWTKFWEEGWRKTPIRVHFKRIALANPEMERLAEQIAKEAEREAEDVAPGTIELGPGSPLASLPAATMPPSGNGSQYEPTSGPAEASGGFDETTGLPIETKSEYQYHTSEALARVKLEIGDVETIMNGATVKFAADLVKLGAKRTPDKLRWQFDSAKVDEFIAYFEQHGITWAEVDTTAKGPAGQGKLL